MVTIAVLVALCFVAGLLARTAMGKGLAGWLEHKVLTLIPGYSLLKGMATGWMGEPGANDLTPALVRLDDTWLLGFVVDRLPDGRVLFFCPDAPSSSSGTLQIVTGDRVQPIRASVAEVLKSLKRLGAGASALLAPTTPP